MIRFHRSPFRLGLRTWRYGIVFRIPFTRMYRVLGR